MPAVNKTTLRELSLTSSFVAGGSAYHFHSGSLIGFFRFEGHPGGTEGRTMLQTGSIRNNYSQGNNTGYSPSGQAGHSSGSWNNTQVNPPCEKDGTRKTAAHLSGSHPAARIVFDSSLTLTGVGVTISGSSESAKPFYTVSSPYRHHNYFPEKGRIANAALFTSASAQVRSMKFGHSGSLYNGDGHVFIGDSNFTRRMFKDGVSRGFTIAGWIRPTEALPAHIRAQTTGSLHFNRPILSDAGTGGNLSFGYTLGLPKTYPPSHNNSGTFGVYDEERDRKLYLRRKVYSTSGVCIGENLWYADKATITDDEWQHVAVTFPPATSVNDKTLAKFYVNGDLIRTVVSSSNSTNNLSLIGGNFYNARAVTVATAQPKLSGSYFKIGGTEDQAHAAYPNTSYSLLHNHRHNSVAAREYTSAANLIAWFRLGTDRWVDGAKMRSGGQWYPYSNRLYLPNDVDDSRDIILNRFYLETEYEDPDNPSETRNRDKPLLTSSVSPSSNAAFGLNNGSVYFDGGVTGETDILTIRGMSTDGSTQVGNPFESSVGLASAGGNGGLFTISMWIRPNEFSSSNTSNAYKNILDLGGFVRLKIGQSNSKFGEISFQVHHGGGTEYTFRSEDAASEIDTSDEWHHLVITYDGSSAGNTPKLYIDGADTDFNSPPTTSGAFDGFISSGSQWQTARIGDSINYQERTNKGHAYRGHLADLAIWNEVLPQSEVLALYHANFSTGMRTTVPLGSAFHGNMDDLAVWTRQLDREDIKAIYAAHMGAYDPKSGYLNNPPRVMLRESDNHPGSYPTHIKPTEDNATPFNDNLTIAGAPQTARAELKFAYVPFHKSKLTLQDSGGRSGDFMFFEESPRDFEGYASGSITIHNILHTLAIGSLRLSDADNNKYYFKFGGKSNQRSQAIGYLTSSDEVDGETSSYYIPRDNLDQVESSYWKSRATGPRDTNLKFALAFKDFINNHKNLKLCFKVLEPKAASSSYQSAVTMTVRSIKKLGTDGHKPIKWLSGLSNGHASVKVESFQGSFYPVDISSTREVLSTNLQSTNTSANQKTRMNIVTALVNKINSAKEIRINAKADGTTLHLEQQNPGPAGNTTITPKISRTRLEGTDAVGFVTDPKGVGLNSSDSPVFSGGRNKTTRYPYRAGSDALDLFKRVQATPYAPTSIEVTDSGDPRILDAPANQHIDSKYTPYNEDHADQTFGMTGIRRIDESSTYERKSSIYGIQTAADSAFITSGAISNFNESLGTKDRLVIDLTPIVSTSIQYRGGNADHTARNSWPMAYFNFDKREWEHIGFGKNSYEAHTAATTNAQATEVTGYTKMIRALDAMYLGFGQSTNMFYDTKANASPRVLEESLKGAHTNDGKVLRETGWASPIDTFGFPYHPKYHATGSQTLTVSTLVDHPFLVEKIVYEFSGSTNSKQDGYKSSYSAKILADLTSTGSIQIPGGTFFILNQRKANPNSTIEKVVSSVAMGGNLAPHGALGDNIVPYENPLTGTLYPATMTSRNLLYSASIPQYRQLSPSGPDVYVDTVRDLVTFGRVGALPTTHPDASPATNASYNKFVDTLQPYAKHPAQFMDLAVEVQGGKSLNGHYTLAASVQAPTKNPAISLFKMDPISGSFGDSSLADYLWLARASSTRNGMDVATGRSPTGEFYGTKTIYENHPLSGANTNKSTKARAAERDSVESPYIIMPGDKLVFGWQAGLGATAGTSGSMMTLGEGSGKLVLYGSYIKDDKPVHNIYLGSLTSDSIHEQVPASPAALDRFETAPTMMYSGSYLEAYVTGTIGHMEPENNTALETNFQRNIARRVVSRVNGNLAGGGTVGARHSLLRGVRLVDSDEQYYDSMQPHPGSMLTYGLDYLLWGDNSANGFVHIQHPYEKGGTKYGAAEEGKSKGFDAVSNYHWIGSFPFETRYSGFERVKSINRATLATIKMDAIQISSVYPKVKVISSPVKGLFYTNFYTGSADSTGNDTGELFRKGGWFSYQPLTGSGLSGEYHERWIGFSGHHDDTETNRFSRDALMSERHEIQHGGYSPFLSKFMGCFGDGVYGVPQFKHHMTATIAEGGLYPLGIPAFNYMRGMIYRGCKYGLINPTPHYSSAVFSHRSFGQFRDMMEPRKYSRFSLSDGTLTDPAVEVTFIDRTIVPDINGVVTNNITSGTATNSSNVSQFATSSHPYDDAGSDYGRIKDRTVVMPEVSIALVQSPFTPGS